MIPVKYRIFCPAAGRAKMSFESEKKANTYLKFNAQDYLEKKGVELARTYYCDSCFLWHVTSSKVKYNLQQSLTDRTIDAYKEVKEKRALLNVQNRELRKIARKATADALSDFEEKISIIRKMIKGNRDPLETNESVRDALAELRTISEKFVVNEKKYLKIETMLKNFLQKVNEAKG